MTHPVFLMHDGNSKIIRIQLMVFSSIVIILSNESMTIKGNIRILGVNIDGFTEIYFFSIMFWLLSYQLIHFLWVSTESFTEWRLRQTALETASWGGNGLIVKSMDQNIKARNNTLYAYLHDVIIDGTDYDKKIEKLNDAFKEIESSNLSKALWRFDHWFKMFNKFQNWRWISIEFGLPATIGVLGIVFSLFYGQPFHHALDIFKKLIFITI